MRVTIVISAMILLGLFTWLMILPALVCHTEHKMIIYFLCLILSPTVIVWLLLIIWAVSSNNGANREDALYELSTGMFRQQPVVEKNAQRNDLKEKIFQLKLLYAQATNPSTKAGYSRLIRETEDEYRLYQQQLESQQQYRIQEEKKEKRAAILGRITRTSILLLLVAGGFVAWQMFTKQNSKVGLSEKVPRQSVSSTSQDVDTKHLTKEELTSWILAAYADETGKNINASDYPVEISLKSDNLAYGVLKNTNGTILGEYRVNSKGKLEKQNTNGEWVATSSEYHTTQ